MKRFNKFFIFIIFFIVLIFAVANIVLVSVNKKEEGRPYRVEIIRLCDVIKNDGYAYLYLNDCKYVTDVILYEGDNEFYKSESDFLIYEINGDLYRFDYNSNDYTDNTLLIVINCIFALILLIVVAIFLFIKHKILKPFENLKDIPYELSRGNLVLPLKEDKNKFFGKFIWGVDLLRENIEKQKERENILRKDKKTMVLSLSHDIKTPLSAIKLYSKAIEKNLYKDSSKQIEIACNINEKTEEIENYIAQIIKASNDDFFEIDVSITEYYLSDLINKINSYYKEKMQDAYINFEIKSFSNCLIKCDFEKSIEVMQNLIENAIKYGDGKLILIDFYEEDNNVIISIKNTGSQLQENEIINIFDCYYRGSNSKGKNGSGLGLYICKVLMNKMNGEIYAENVNNIMSISLVFSKA